MSKTGRVTVIDASAAIVLAATGHITAILNVWPGRIAIVEETLAEVLYLRDRDASATPPPRERLDLRRVAEKGSLEIVALDLATEAADFTRLAQDLGDGEAAAGAVAINRGWAVAIDDKKARRLIGGAADLYWSLELVSAWASASHLAADDMAHVLTQIRRRASYVPHRGHPLHPWWTANGGPR